KDGVAFVLEPLRGDVLRLFDQADHRHGRRRVDRAAGPLVVKADVPAGDRRVQGPAGLSQAAYGFAELPEGLGVVRSAKIEIVAHAEPPGAAASQVAAGFGNGNLAPFEGIKINVGGIAVNGEGDQLLRDSCSVFRAFAFAGAWLFGTHRRQGVLFNANDSGIGAGRDNGAVADGLVVLAVNPIFRRYDRPAQELFEVVQRILRVRQTGERKRADGL